MALYEPAAAAAAGLQELVFIGIGLREAELRDALDCCLVTVTEAEASGFSGLEDPFEPWPEVQDMIDGGKDKMVHVFFCRIICNYMSIHTYLIICYFNKYPIMSFHKYLIISFHFQPEL